MELKIYYLKLDNCARYSNNVKAKAINPVTLAETGEFFMRIDTGADISVVPERMVNFPLPNKGNILIRSVVNDTRAICQDCIMALEAINGQWQRYITGNGVLMRPYTYGLLGCDVLNQVDMLMVAGIAIIETGVDSL